MNVFKRFTNSPRALFMSYLLLIAISAVLYQMFEAGKTIGDSLWWAVVTASTVGYGDTYPLTPAGRILAGILISTMILFVIPLITAHFASKLIVDNDAFQHEEQEEIKNQLREIRNVVDRLEGSLTGSGRESLIAKLDEVETRVRKDLGA